MRTGTLGCVSWFCLCHANSSDGIRALQAVQGRLCIEKDSLQTSYTDVSTIDLSVPFARKVMVACLAVAIAAGNQVCTYQGVKFLSHTKAWQAVPPVLSSCPLLGSHPVLGIAYPICTRSRSAIAICTPLLLLTAECNTMEIAFRELENMVHGGRPLPSNPAAARPPILWAEDFVAIAGSLPLMDPQGGLKPLPESGPYVQPVSFQGATALHLAAFYGHLAVTDLLLAAGACDVTARNIQVTAQNTCALLPSGCNVLLVVAWCIRAHAM